MTSRIKFHSIRSGVFTHEKVGGGGINANGQQVLALSKVSGRLASEIACRRGFCANVFSMNFAEGNHGIK